MTLNEATRQVDVDKSTFSRVIERLVLKGWASRSEGPDRRSVGLRLTSAGRKLVPKLAKLADENDEAFFRPFTPAT